MNKSAGELVALSRQGSLVEGAELTLHDMATQLAQRWADRLARSDARCRHRPKATWTWRSRPAPSSTSSTWSSPTSSAGGKGPVRITFLAEHDHLRIRMPAGVVANGSRRRGPAPGAGIAEARKVAESLGGRVTGDGQAEDLEILLPRR